MIRETKREVIDTMYICDLCGKESTGMHRCMYCNRHACMDHMEHISNDPITGCDYGDYPERMCSECYQKIHTGEIAQMIAYYKERSNDLDNFHSQIEDTIRKVCRGVVNV